MGEKDRYRDSLHADSTSEAADPRGQRRVSLPEKRRDESQVPYVITSRRRLSLTALVIRGRLTSSATFALHGEGQPTLRRDELRLDELRGQTSESESDLAVLSQLNKHGYKVSLCV